MQHSFLLVSTLSSFLSEPGENVIGALTFRALCGTVATFSHLCYSLQDFTGLDTHYKIFTLFERDMKCECITCDLLTSMSSLFANSGASMIFLSRKFSDSTSNWCPVTVAILSQWRSFIALLAINSRRGQHSLKSSIFFFSSLNACHSLRALGSLRHLIYYTKAL